MTTETIELSRFLPAPPLRIYDAWLDADDHAAMTGGKATVESREVGGRFSAWDGYIDGSHVALDPGVRIVQSWRSDDFPAEALDSRVEILLAPEGDGTRITIRHGDIPAGQGPGLLEGWDEYYLAPMERFFLGELRASRAGARPGRRAAARKGAATGARKARGTGARAAAKAGRKPPAKAASKAARKPAPAAVKRKRPPARKRAAPRKVRRAARR